MGERLYLQFEGEKIMKRIAVIGAGLLGKQIAHHIKSDQGYEIVGFFDDLAEDSSNQEYGPILGRTDQVKQLFKNGVFDQAIIGIGYKHFNYRWNCFESLRGIVPFHTFIHSSCFVDKTSRIGEGSFLMPGTIIDDHVSIGENVFLQVGCSISHHSRIQDNCFFGPRVTLAGCVTVERGCFLGVGSIVIDSVNIASNVQTGGGTVVISDIQDQGVYVGAPAHKIR
jgi:sugar O-acyltransferase (sialic acid O-acetyltransferase NeuD family)